MSNYASGRAYAVLFYNGSQYKNKVYLDYVDPTINDIDELVYSSGKLILFFTSMLEVYPVANYTLGAKILTQTYNTTSKYNLDIEANNQILTFCISNKLYRFDLAALKYTLSYSFNSTDIIHSVTEIPSTCYIMVKMSYSIIQFDYCIISPIVNESVSSSSMQKISSFGTGYSTGFILYTDEVGNYTNNYQIYLVTPEYICPLCICLQSYIQNMLQGLCYKDANAIYSPTYLNITLNAINPQSQQINNNQTNSTTQNTTNTTNNSSYSPTNPSTNPITLPTTIPQP